MTEQVQQQEVVQEPVAQQPASSDPFSLDENALVSLSPEQRASLDPIIGSWKQKATEEISKREAEISKYKAYGDKATALDKLTQYQPFVQWWNQEQMKAQGQATSQGQSNAISNTKPQDIASQAEWQEAIYNASIGDGSKLQELQQKMLANFASPFIANLQDKQNKLDTKLEMRDMFEMHPDAKELDSIGIDPKTKEGISLLEACITYTQEHGQPIEEGYKLARRWADALKVSAQQQAMGMVQEKKQAIVQGPSTSSSSKNVVEVDNVDELLKRSMQSQMEGNKDAQFVLRKK